MRNPDYNGVLTPEDRQVIDAWIKANWRMGNCPVCRKQNWALADHVVTPVLHSGVRFILGVEYPQIIIICQGCGYTLYFNAIIAGITEGKLNAEP